MYDVRGLLGRVGGMGLCYRAIACGWLRVRGLGVHEVWLVGRRNGCKCVRLRRGVILALFNGLCMSSGGLCTVD